jgi:hypothetical protein
MTPDRLYHFTCADAHKRIGRYNCVLTPQRGLWPYIWLTTEAEPDFEATGLGSITLTCDRTEYRYIVTDIAACKPWSGSPERAAVHPDFLETLESFGDPAHWWISAGPVRAAWDRAWSRFRTDTEVAS